VLKKKGDQTEDDTQRHGGREGKVNKGKDHSSLDSP